MMPPAGRPRPDPETYAGLTSHLETELDRAAAVEPRSRPQQRAAPAQRHGVPQRDTGPAGPGGRRRGAAAPPTTPARDSTTSVSAGSIPGRLERYLTAARRISRLAVGAPVRSPVADTFIVPSDLNQTGHVEGLPFGTRGGARQSDYNFPVDAEYELRVELGKSWNTNRVGGLQTTARCRDHARRRAGAGNDRHAHASSRPRPGHPVPTCRPARGRRSGDPYAGDGGPARRRRGVRGPGPGARRTTPPAVPEGAHHRRRRSADAAQRLLDHRHRTVRRERPRRHAEPPAHLHLPAGGHDARRRGRLRDGDSLTTLARRAYRRPVDRRGRRPAGRVLPPGP